MRGGEFIVRGLLVVLATIFALELAGAALRFLTPELFRQSAMLDAGLRGLTAKDFSSFVSSAASVSAVWQPSPASRATTRDCLGRDHTAEYSAAGARTFRGYSDAHAEVLLIGDSYTHGDEVGDEETIGAHLFRLSRIVAANLGVGGYSPLQAVLRAKQKLEDFPAARVVVLGIMYENIRRNINSYIHALAGENSGVLGIRPFARDGQIHLVPKAALEDLEKFRAYVRRAYRDDFWAKPEAAFPNSLSLLNMLTSQQYRIRAGGRVLRPGAVGERWAGEVSRAFSALEEAHQASKLPAEPEGEADLEAWLLAERRKRL